MYYLHHIICAFLITSFKGYFTFIIFLEFKLDLILSKLQSDSTISFNHSTQPFHLSPNPNRRLPRINQTNGLLVRLRRFHFLTFTIQQLRHSVVIVDQFNLIGVKFVIEHLLKGFFRFLEPTTLHVSHTQIEIGFYRFSPPYVELISFAASYN